MQELKKGNIYTFRYIWQIKGHEGLQCKYLTGTKEEHDVFINALINDESVQGAFYEYIYEIDTNRILRTEVVKDKEVKVDEKV